MLSCLWDGAYIQHLDIASLQEVCSDSDGIRLGVGLVGTGIENEVA